MPCGLVSSVIPELRYSSSPLPSNCGSPSSHRAPCVPAPPRSHLQEDYASVDGELNVTAVIHTEKGLREADAASRPATQPPGQQPDVLGSRRRRRTWGHLGQGEWGPVPGYAGLQEGL